MRNCQYDPLNHLPRVRPSGVPKGSVLYEPTRPAQALQLVLSGHLKVSCIAPDGGETLLRIVKPEGFVGETALLPNATNLKESAVALEDTQVMSWTAEQIIDQIGREPMLALGLFEYFNQCNRDFRDRVALASWYHTGTRVAVALLKLARTIGAMMPDGALRITHLTHQNLADYVGTSREIVTCEMNRLRRLGYLSYSRRYIDVSTEALAEWLRQDSAISVPNERVQAVIGTA